MIPLRDDNPTHRFPILTVGLIAACLAVFLLQLQKPADGSLEGRQAFTCEFGLVADYVTDGADPPGDTTACESLAQSHNRYLGLFSSQFLHGGWLHLIGNMLFLWVFGNNIEDRLGRLRFLPFYLICGALAGLAHVLSDPESAIPLIGASGAISGVLGAYLVLYPRIGVWTVVLPFFFLPFKIPAWMWLIIYFGLQFLYLGQLATAGVDEAGGVAYLAHIGGFVAGAALIKVFAAGREEPPRPASPYPVY